MLTHLESEAARARESPRLAMDVLGVELDAE
jgi:hypothetical protein